MTTQQRFTCWQLGTLASSLDYWEKETRKREAQLPGLQGMAYQRVAMAFQEAVQRQQRAITDLRGGTRRRGDRLGTSTGGRQRRGAGERLHPIAKRDSTEPRCPYEQ